MGVEMTIAQHQRWPAVHAAPVDLSALEPRPQAQASSAVIAAAQHFTATMKAIDRAARHELRTLPTDGERLAALMAFWAVVESLEDAEATATPDEFAKLSTAV